MQIDHKKLRNIAWCIQLERRDPKHDAWLKIIEATALRWVHEPMLGPRNLNTDEIADILEGK